MASTTATLPSLPPLPPPTDMPSPPPPGSREDTSHTSLLTDTTDSPVFCSSLSPCDDNDVRQLTTDVTIIDFAEDVKKQLNSTNDAYRVMHEKLGHSEPLKENDILAIDTLVNNYMSLYRQNFPGRCLPKHHFLEKHCPEWATMHGHGMTFLGETGFELVHQTLATAERSARNFGASERGQLTILERHFLTTAPSLLIIKPVKKEVLSRRKCAKFLEF